MKPTKNRVFCPDCWRAKMVFPTLKKALNFIRYNKQDIIKEHGYAPVRAYYCGACNGWHLTSKWIDKKKNEEEPSQTEKNGLSDNTEIISS